MTRNIDWSFEDKTALVTGASRGIGLAIANLLSEAGAHVLALSTSGTSADLCHRARALALDVSDRGGLAAAARAAADITGRVDIAIANAGIALVEDFRATDAAEWRRVVDVNLLGVMGTWQAVLPYMLDDGGGGRLIAVSSTAGLRGEAGTPIYSATKSALTGLVQALAIEYAPHGVTVNAVAPGEIDTRLNHRGRASFAQRAGRPADELLQDLLEGGVPAGRLGEPGEVASLVGFLASHEARYITGQTIVIDGGQLLV